MTFIICNAQCAPEFLYLNFRMCCVYILKILCYRYLLESSIVFTFWFDHKFILTSLTFNFCNLLIFAPLLIHKTTFRNVLVDSWNNSPNRQSAYGYSVRLSSPFDLGKSCLRIHLIRVILDEEGEEEEEAFRSKPLLLWRFRPVKKKYNCFWDLLLTE